MSDSDQTFAAHEESTVVDRKRRATLGRAARATALGVSASPMDGSREAPVDRSEAVEQAVEEFARLKAGNPDLSISDYCQRNGSLDSSVRSSIHRQLELDACLAEHSWLREATAPMAWPARGDELGSFLVLEELGRGAMARVYLCSQPGLGDRQVVVKLGRGVPLEAHTLGQLLHPNIVPVYSVEFRDEQQAALICMPFLGRSTLCDLVDVAFAGGRPTSSQVLLQAARRRQQANDMVIEAAGQASVDLDRSYFECIAELGAQLAGALAHAHGRGVLHGDIKPSNTLLSVHGEPLLMDFNLGGNAALSIAPRGGTLPYMPPEQLRAICTSDPRNAYDCRSDVFSLGVVLYELATGRLPFPIDGDEDATSRAPLTYERQKLGCVPLRDVDPTIPARLAHTIESCLTWRPEDRLASADELRSLLVAFGKDARRAKKRRSALRVAAPLLAVVGMAAAWLAYDRSPGYSQLLAQGQRLNRERSYAAAAEQLRLAVAWEPTQPAARFDLARALLGERDVQGASREFHTLATEFNDPASACYLAYCYGLQGNASSAIAWYSRAHAAGVESVELHNNLAVAYLTGRSEGSLSTRLDAARRHAAKALSLAPDSQTVRLNWILVELKLAAHEQRAVTPEAVQICRALAAECPECGVVQYSAAHAIVRSGVRTSETADEALEFVRRASLLGHGLPPDTLADQPPWDLLRLSPRYSQLGLGGPVAGADSSRDRQIPRLLEPTALGTAATAPSIAN